jgi:arylsulfatase A-like enzyme
MSDEPNVLIVTLDSCRFDSLCYAKTPNLDQLGHKRKAVAFGTFTLPAHMALFSGYIPNVIELPHEDLYSRERLQLWRLTRAKQKAHDTYRLLLAGDTITEGFRNRGYKVVGAGGVRWFLTKTLTELFDEFHFWGPRDYSNWFIERQAADFALNHVEELAAAVSNAPRWCLFVNALETHAPYNNGVDPPDPKVRAIIEKAAPIWAGKVQHKLNVTVTEAEFKTLHRAQIRAAEVADARIGRLLQVLPKPITVVVCGDHGECFGEQGRWGHGFPDDMILNVPLVVGTVA